MTNDKSTKLLKQIKKKTVIKFSIVTVNKKKKFNYILHKITY